MKVTLKEIAEDENKHFMWCIGFGHGNLDIPKQVPSYEKESYELGYKMGEEGKIGEYIKMVKMFDERIKTEKSYTRKK